MKHNLLQIFFGLAIAVLLLSNTSYAGDSTSVQPGIGADIMSRFIWRGLQLSYAPTIQPTLDFTVGNFSFGSWASYTITPDALQEVDLYLSYTKKWFTLTVNDYYNPIDSVGYKNHYFNWESKSSPHTLEVAASFSEFEKLPLSFTAGVFVYGNDRNDNGENMYSTYLEVAYSKTIKESDVDLFLGLTPYEGYYADAFKVINVGVAVSKEVQVSQTFTLPISGSLVLNPDAENIFFVFGISL